MIEFPPSVPVEDVTGLPAISRGIALLSGLIRQMSFDAYEGEQILPRTRFLDRPDPTPNTARSWWVGNQVEDYLLHGNAIHLVTARDGSGRPMAATWLPAQWVGITPDPEEPWKPAYWCRGIQLRAEDVVHVRRGADRWYPWRGVGIVEQHLTEFSKLRKQQQHEDGAYSSSGVPSVAVITPNSDLSQEEADKAKTAWMEKFVRREPVILPSGTEVKPLAWSPSDSQMVEAHEMSLVDVANMLNIDPAWLGGKSRGLTYKNIGTLFLGLVRETIDPITDEFEQIWGDAWLGHPFKLRFHKNEILTNDLPTEVDWVVKAMEAGLVSRDEGRARIEYPPSTGSSGSGSVTTAAEVAQKIYLPVRDQILTIDEARDMINQAGGNLS